VASLHDCRRRVDLLNSLVIWLLTTPYNSLVTSSLLLLGSGFQQWTFVFLLVPELSPTSTNSNSSKQLNLSSSVINSQTYQWLLIVETLLSNSCCTFAHFAIA
jgi:hypothetical protein